MRRSILVLSAICWIYLVWGKVFSVKKGVASELAVNARIIYVLQRSGDVMQQIHKGFDVHELSPHRELFEAHTACIFTDDDKLIDEYGTSYVFSSEPSGYRVLVISQRTALNPALLGDHFYMWE